LPDAPVEQMANALYNRGVAWSQEDQADKALADYTYLIEQLPDAPAEQVAGALANRGWLRYERNDYCGFLADTEAALSKAPPSDIAAFSLGLALLACYRDLDALAAYRSAAEQFPEQIDILALPDLAEARRKWLSDERAEPVIQLLQSLRTPPRR
jgi:tetratricopeptide (TPR) repeat protein